MKAVIAVTQLVTFAAQFRRNIVLWDDTEVPLNAISFIISGSGKNKDSSVRAAYKCFEPGYDLIKATNNKLLTQDAISKAEQAGEDPADIEAIYQPYMIPEVDIETMVTTGPGLIDHINSVMDMPLGASLVSSSEFSDELAYNPDMVENIKVLAETFDLGKKQAKHTKGAEFRSRSINGASTNALFIGSPGYILYDEPTRKKFEIAFMSKLARRSFFCYSPDKVPEPQFDNIADLLDYEDSLEATAKQARSNMSDYIQSVAEFGLATVNQPLPVSKEVEHMFKIYKRYNSELVDTSTNPESTSSLIRMHAQWRALKLAGALALMDKANSIELSHYLDAIRFCELLDSDMHIFEGHLNKSDHERFSDYIRTQVDTSGTASISLHDLKKKGFLKSTTASKLHELVTLAAGYDKLGIYNVSSDGSSIEYEPVVTSDSIGISYKPIDCTLLNSAIEAGDKDLVRQAKHDISVTTAYGYELADTTFDQLGDLLAGDFAYSPFKFNNGVRGKDNIIGGTSWICLDIDDSPITASEAHFMLSDLNHYVALSSDPSNEFKFRVLIELDSNIELSPIAWKHFYLAIANDLALKVDPLPQSQIFFSYAGRPVISNLDASPLVTRDYIILAKEKEAERNSRQSTLTNAQKTTQLKDIENTFSYAFNASNGEKSRSLIRAAYHARDLGADLDQTLTIISDIYEFWGYDPEADRYKAIIEQVTRMF